MSELRISRWRGFVSGLMRLMTFWVKLGSNLVWVLVPLLWPFVASVVPLVPLAVPFVPTVAIVVMCEWRGRCIRAVRLQVAMD